MAPTISASFNRGSEGDGVKLQSDQSDEAWIRLTGQVHSTYLKDWA